MLEKSYIAINEMLKLILVRTQAEMTKILLGTGKKVIFVIKW